LEYHLAAIDFIKADLGLNSSSLKLRGRDEVIQASREANKVQLSRTNAPGPYICHFVHPVIHPIFIAANGK
jgi:hypothetical protein